RRVALEAPRLPAARTRPRKRGLRARRRTPGRRQRAPDRDVRLRERREGAPDPAGTQEHERRRSGVPLRGRRRCRRVLLDRRPLRLRVGRRPRSFATPHDRRARLQAACRGGRERLSGVEFALLLHLCAATVIGTLLAPKFIVLYVFVASALFVHYRGRVRHKLTKQLADHSTIMAPYNSLMYLFSAVPAKPILDPRMLPELDALRDNWQVIRDEAVALMDDGQIRAATGHNDLGFNSFFKNGWKRFYVKWYAEPLPSAQAACPKTVALVESLPSVNAAMFALLPPGAKLNRHRDPFAGSLRYHLG